ncbi:MAG: L-aspartate oxidase [Candidatus Obscuribacterales bacterium]|nr:L-aspartate oxidase [Candidatus Obscuribacterales bacterium]
MSYANPNRKNVDVIILGSGIAGLVLAAELNLKGLKVALSCKGQLLESNTSFAQGGIAAVTGVNQADSVEAHLKDTLLAGAGLTDESIARTIITDAKSAISRLEELGVYFDRADGALELAREGGHCQARVLHRKDTSGFAISQALIAHLRSCDRIQIYENMFAHELIMQDNTCTGVRFLLEEQLVELRASHVVLATGGLGQAFSRTTNPSIATGDGIAMAYRAGARLADMEFVQFHPTALSLPSTPAFLISEAVRGAGAHLIDSEGARFVQRFHADGELATRDVVSRAIFSVMTERNEPSVFLDLRPIGAKGILHEFPNIVQTCRNWGIDPLVRPIPVSPAAHYFMGGVWTDDRGLTSIPGLYAVGECASTGLHGANRLASNSLLEGAVMARRLAQVISGSVISLNVRRTPVQAAGFKAPVARESLDRFRQLMWQHAGLIRQGASLAEFIDSSLSETLHQVPLVQAEIEAANIRLLGHLIAQAASNRQESRGAHWRSDYPACDDKNYKRRHMMARSGNAWLELPLPAPLLRAEAMAFAK